MNQKEFMGVINVFLNFYLWYIFNAVFSMWHSPCCVLNVAFSMLHSQCCILHVVFSMLFCINVVFCVLSLLCSAAEGWSDRSR